MKKNFPVLALAVCATAFVVGVVYLFLLRFEAGDVYPPYSSLRADPLGAMAFYESLEQMPRLAVRRDFSVANRLPEERSTTYLHLAAETSEWRQMPAELFDEVEGFVTRGGRLVITFLPVTRREFSFPSTPLTNTPSTNTPPGKSATPPLKSKSKKLSKDAERLLNEVSLEKRWGVAFGHVDLKQGDNDVYEPAQVVNRSDLPLPARMDWHSALVFTNLGQAWRTIYARGRNPVVIERRFARGTVVMATDSYFLSNEAMWKSRHADLLAWLVGGIL